MSKSIQHQYFFPNPPEVVWEYLTRPELMELWLMKNDFQPVVGHEFRFTTGAMADMDFNGIIHCKVMEVIPFEKLTYTWQSGGNDGKIALDSLVVWTLQKKENGTELFLDHSGFTDKTNQMMFGAMNNGWKNNIQKIDKFINTTQHEATNA